MQKFFSRLAILLLLGFFIYSAATIISSMVLLNNSAKENAEAVEKYTVPVTVPAETGDDTAPEYDRAPITVDFDALKWVNGDIVGWLYCADPDLNYPVLHTNNNSYYLKHSYTGKYSPGGAIFVDSRNRDEFVDGNTIIYGHHMPDNTMLTCLEFWDGQEYYDSHKEMYLLTPQGDYRIEIIAGYVVPANSNTYTVVYKPGRDVESYLEKIMERSVFETEVEADPNARYVLLSTCSHKYDNARAVIHGKLVPLDTVGGVLPEEEQAA